MQRHEDELARFCAEAYPRLVGALAHQFGDRLVAEDLAQEALVRACDRWATVRRLDAPVGWAFRVGVNLGRSRFRRRAAEQRARARRGPDPEAYDDPDVPDRMAVAQALDRLTDRQRATVVLRYFLRLTAGEVADVLSTTEGAVRATTHRALAALRMVLGESMAAEEPSDVS